MDIFKKYSLSDFIGRFGQSFKRFPLAMLLSLFLACFLIYINHGGDVGKNMEFFLMFYPATGALLAVALSLLTEDFKSRYVAVAVQVVIHVAWFAVSYYLAQFDRFSMPQMIAVSATVATIGLAVFLICFYRRNHDLPFWNFSIRTILALVMAFAIGGILYMGLLLLVESLKMLFGLHIDGTVYPDIAIVCMVLLAPALFMNLIPKREQKYLYDVPEFSGFAKGVVQYLFLPLLGLYMLTLYAYGAKILFRWSLPVGGVSYLVSGSMVLMVLLIYLTYPIQHTEGNKLFKRVTRWLPVLMLPLLALMTAAIWRRLADYGITVSRLYLLVFNLWCYAVCLWLIFTRNKRIWLIPASFAVILFLISVGPQSIANVTRRQLKKEIRNAFISSGIQQFPLTGEQYEQWINKADPKVAISIDSKLDYLRSKYDFGTIGDLLGKDAAIGRLSKSDRDVISPISYCNDHMIRNVALPQGYSRFTKVDYYDSDADLVDGNRLQVEFSDGQGVEHRFNIDKKAFAVHDRERNSQAEPIIFDNGKDLLMIDEYSMYSYNDSTFYLNFSGLLFIK